MADQGEHVIYGAAVLLAVWGAAVLLYVVQMIMQGYSSCVVGALPPDNLSFIKTIVCRTWRIPCIA